jgi:dTDP-glucose 4,6-dehydratase
MRECGCDGVVHMAADSHVDRSIRDPGRVMRNNVSGTFELLQASRGYWESLEPERRAEFRFLHVSTAEVYGNSMHEQGFAEDAPYRPSSPYAASKAAGDQFVHAFGITFGLPMMMTHCCNTYGPRQLANKLVPLTIGRALRGESIQVYGRGENLRDWIHVRDYSMALIALLSRGVIGQVYHIAGGNLLTNLSMVTTICNTVDRVLSGESQRSSTDLIEFVADRPGHDQCCYLDGTKLTEELGWVPRQEFSAGIVETVRWYVENSSWFDVPC